jgi:hypothetical protein
MRSTATLASFVLAPVLVSAHGRITNITTPSGTLYTGWDPEVALSINTSSLPQLAAWSASNLGNIFVPPSSFNTSNITCHFNSAPGALHVNTTSGDTLKLQWNEWPTSHVGPVMNYLAPCNSSCTDADKEKLKWVKIDEMGWLNSTGSELGLGGTWASDLLIKNGFSWEVRIPEGLAEGAYVLRHEIIALHVANEVNGAQAYPQCVNIFIGKNTKQSEDVNKIEGGVVGSELYSATDKGILVDIHGNVTGYEIPGPKLWSRASWRAKQPAERRSKTTKQTYKNRESQ